MHYPKCPTCGHRHSPQVLCPGVRCAGDVSRTGNMPDSGNLNTPAPSSSSGANPEQVLCTEEVTGVIRDYFVDDGRGCGEESHPEPVETSSYFEAPCGSGESIPLWEQALWLARHIDEIYSPRPEVVSDDELRGMTLIRVITIGAEEHGDDVFYLSNEVLKGERKEEWSDAEFYDLVDRFGGEIRRGPDPIASWPLPVADWDV